jgi:hypothetical protein
MSFWREILLVVLSMPFSWCAWGGTVEVLWTIGDAAQDETQFALRFEEYAKYPKMFPEGVVYTVGESEPARHWPAMLPGPADVWAGNRRHAHKILFRIGASPPGALVLRVALSAVHPDVPPLLEFHIDGEHFSSRQLRKGQSEQAGEDPQVIEVPLPGRVLEAGPHTLEIRNVSGSWVRYRQLSLEVWPEEPLGTLKSFGVSPSVFWVREGGELRQVLLLTAEFQGIADPDKPWSFRVRANGKVREHRFSTGALQKRAVDLPVEAVDRPTSIQVEADGGHKTEVTLLPSRQWKVFVVAKTHYDLGYTSSVETMLRQARTEHLDLLLDYCRKSRRQHPSGSRFAWTFPSWVLAHLLEEATPEQREKLEEFIRGGQVQWSAFPFTLHSTFTGLEELARSVKWARVFSERFGVPSLFAKQTDVPGHSRFLPQLLAKSGVELLQVGANNGVRGISLPMLFYWEAPDGSRMLTHWTNGYGIPWTPDLLKQLEDPASEYPYDAYLSVVVSNDNVGPGGMDRIAEEATELNARYAFPSIQIGRPEAFARHIAEHWREEVPVLKVEMADWWIHGVASDARNTALARQAKELLPVAEKLDAVSWMLGRKDRPDFDQGWTQLLLYSEHTWGVAGGKVQPQPPEKRDLDTNPAYEPMRISWEVKGAYAREAFLQAYGESARGVEELVSRVKTDGPSIVVFNPSGFERSAVVSLPAKELTGGLVDVETGEGIPVQALGDETVFVARDVPAMGYRTYRISEKGVVKGEETREGRIESDRYRIEFDREKGSVNRLWDRHLKRDLLEESPPEPFGSYLYEIHGKMQNPAGWHGTSWAPEEGSGRLTGEFVGLGARTGPVVSELLIERHLEVPGFTVEVGDTEKILTRIRLYRELDRIDCEVELKGKRPTALIEAGHVVFPFNVPGARILVEQHGAPTDIACDLHSGSNHDMLAAGRWVDVSNDAFGVTLCPIDAPLVSFGEPRLAQWSGDYVPARPAIYANVLNNAWSTNFTEWQGGDFRFRYLLRSHQGDWRQGDAPGFSEGVVPFLTARVEGRQEGRLGPVDSFLSVSPPGVRLVNVTRDDEGLLVRLFEQTGRAVSVCIRFPLVVARAAAEVDLMGRKLRSLEVRSGSVEVELGPYALVTVRLED